MDKTRKWILGIYGTALLLGGSYYLWGELTGRYLPCYLYQLTKIQCAGCGVSRMFLSMLELDMVAAFRYNPVIFCLFFLWNGIALLCFLGKPRIFRSERFLLTALAISVAALLLLWIVRIFLFLSIAY